MNKAQEEAAYFAVIPAPVRYDAELSAAAKLLYCEITSLCKKKGYCWATNQYFAELLNNVSVSTISRLIAQLERRGHIRAETATVSTGSERRIYIDVCYAGQVGCEGSEGDTQKTQRGVCKNEETGVRKKRKQNDYHLNDYKKDPPYSPPEGDAPPADSGPVDKPKGQARKARKKKSVPDHAPERFEQFWAVYPVGGSRLKAVEAWDALAPSDELIDEMARALKRQMRSRLWRDGIGIPHACRWLSDQRWTDKLPEAPMREDTGGWADDPEVRS